MVKEKLLTVRNLKTYFYTAEGVSKAVDGVDFEIFPSEILGVVGESGCGKSVTAYSIMRLVQEPPGKIIEGEIFFKGENLLKLSQKKMLSIRGNDISMIFQEPMTSLNPVFTIGDQISEAILAHKHINKKEAKKKTIEMLKKVGIPLPEQRFNEYSFQLSGGMLQRVMIAMALSCDPQLLIADEPTTALDVTIQAQILNLINNLKTQFGMSIMLITHNMGIIAEVSDRVAVMYAGKVVEYTDVKTLFANPKHPYTWGLMNSIPKIGQKIERLKTIPGVVPNPLKFPKGCKFNNRCVLADEKCFSQEPDLIEVEKGHKVRCWHYQRLEELKNSTARY